MALLRAAGIEDELLAGVADASPTEQGCRVPGTRMPVISPADLVAARPAQVLLFVPTCSRRCAGHYRRSKRAAVGGSLRARSATDE